MPRTPRTAMTSRQSLRWAHIALAALLGAFVYGPWVDIAWFTALIRVAAFPSLVLTGLLMWQAPRLRRALRRGGNRAARLDPAPRS